MDHEVIPRPCKINDWLLNSSRDHFSLHQEKRMWVRVTMHGVRGPQKTCFLRPTLSTHMVQRILRWEGSKRYSSGKRQRPWRRSDAITNFCWFFCSGKRRRWQEKTREWSNLNLSKFPFLGIYLKKIHTLTFWCMVIPLGPHSVHT